jgi:hypothetical protein
MIFVVNASAMLQFYALLSEILEVVEVLARRGSERMRQ